MVNTVAAMQSLDIAYTSIIENLPYAVGIKNKDSVYVGANTLLAKLAGVSSVDKIMGMNDSMLPSDAAQFHDDFAKQDQKVLQGNIEINVDICRYTGNELSAFQTIKKPIYSNNNDVYVMFSMIKMPLRTMLALIQATTHHSLQTIFKRGGTFALKQTPSLDNPTQTLTEKQHEVLYHLLQARSQKEIAHYMKLSPRTIEDHIARLKSKLGCVTRAQLTEKAIALEYTKIVPFSLINAV